MLSKRLTTATDPPLVDIWEPVSVVSQPVNRTFLWFVPVIADGRIGGAVLIAVMAVRFQSTPVIADGRIQ